VAAQGWPKDAAGLRELPGVGPYTAAAVASIAWGEPAAAVDGNVARVVSRLCGLRGNGAAWRKAVGREAAALVDPGRPGDWNQALMDLGSGVCSPRSPDCAACPLRRLCRASQDGNAHLLPSPRPQARPKVEARHVVLVEQEKRVLVAPASEGLLAGMWMLPGGGPRRGLPSRVLQETGLTVEVGEVARRVRHAFSHRTWDLVVHRARVVGGRPRPPARWATAGQLRDGPVPAVLRKAIHNP
jgi:A/G-specific adenine glycosylase